MTDLQGFPTRENCFGDGERAEVKDYDSFRDEPTDEGLAQLADCKTPARCDFCDRILDRHGAHLGLYALRVCLRKCGEGA